MDIEQLGQVDERGGCPKCTGCDGEIVHGFNVYRVCHQHKLKWWAGRDYEWDNHSDQERDAHRHLCRAYPEVRPLLPDPTNDKPPVNPWTLHYYERLFHLAHWQTYCTRDKKNHQPGGAYCELCASERRNPCMHGQNLTDFDRDMLTRLETGE